MQFVIRPNAENILSSIEKNVMDYGGRILDDLNSKLVSLGSDGAAVVIGRIGGVAALLKQKKTHFTKHMLFCTPPRTGIQRCS